MAQPARKKRQRGSIRQRGNSYLVEVYAGTDPLTGKRLYLNGSTTDDREAERIRTRLLAQVDAQHHARTKATLGYTYAEWLKTAEIDDSTRHTYATYPRLYLEPAKLANEPVGRITVKVLEDFYAQLRRCSALCDGRPYVEHRIDGEHECREVRHRRPPGRRPAGGYPQHDCTEAGCRVIECQSHECRPLSNSTVLKVHYALSGALSAAVRWEWTDTNPAKAAKKPRQPTPDPQPPTAEQAVRIIEAAWEEDADWGTLVWLVMVTGLRRAELLALRWSHIDLAGATVTVRRNWVAGKEKDTKTHQMRRISLAPATVEVLTEHHQRYAQRMSQLKLDARDDAFVFSYKPTHDRPCDPDAVTHRYSRMCEKLGIDSHLHALRHYSATELLTAGVDLRTVAGRLGHAGGGATTLRVYAAWVAESDKSAAQILDSRMKRPRSAK